MIENTTSACKPLKSLFLVLLLTQVSGISESFQTLVYLVEWGQGETKISTSKTPLQKLIIGLKMLSSIFQSNGFCKVSANLL